MRLCKTYFTLLSWTIRASTVTILSIPGVFRDYVIHPAFNYYEDIVNYILGNKRKIEVKYYLYKLENGQQFTKIDSGSLQQFENRASRIVFLIHGWLNEKETCWIQKMKNALLTKCNDNWVIIVDWKKPASQLYYTSCKNTLEVSKSINNILVSLYRDQGVDKKHILLIGHSLGGQIAGLVGKLFKDETGEKLSRIIALDPAGPWFNDKPEHERLSKEDAEVVQVIHTAGYFLGSNRQCGTIDFYLNGGLAQPGFILSLPKMYEFGITSHFKAVCYFRKAVLENKRFMATKCDGVLETESIGNLDTAKTGEFYLKIEPDLIYHIKTLRDRLTGYLKLQFGLYSPASHLK